MSDTRLLGKLKSWLRPRPVLPAELQAGLDVIAAIDAGGLPLNPARINRIARALGLEVSAQAPVEQTVERMRAAVLRGLDGLAMQERAQQGKEGRK